MSKFNSSAARSSAAAIFAVTVISLTAWTMESYLGYLQRNSNQTTAQYHGTSPTHQESRG
jgi:hypothetical protein